MIEGKYEFIQETCPKCGNDLIKADLLMFPVIRQIKCPNIDCDFEVLLRPKTVRKVYDVNKILKE